MKTKLKKLLTILPTIVVLGHAKAEVITLIYPFSLANPMAQYSRSLAIEANNLQKKYTFILDAKPGAGGAIAAKFVETNTNAVLATSTAFFVRPNFYPNESYDPNNFLPLMVQCTSPMAVASSKFKSWQEVPRESQLNIGISGLGATSHFVAIQIKNKYSNAELVPYKSTRDSLLDLVSGRIDFHVGFVGELVPWVTENKVTILGVTGKTTVSGIPTLSSQGFSNTEQIVQIHSLMVPKSMPNSTYTEIREIFMNAARSRSVQESYSVDYCANLVLDSQQTQQWYVSQQKLWQNLSQKVLKNN